MQQPAWSFVIPLVVATIALVGGAFGALVQQLVTIWKTSREHRQELQRRVFDAKFKTAMEVTVALCTAARFFRTWLAEADEWTRADARQDVLAARQQAVALRDQALLTAIQESDRAFALMELLFPPSVWLHQYETAPGVMLSDVLQAFEERRSAFKVALNQQISEERSAEIAMQRTLGTSDATALRELQDWWSLYERGLAELREMLPDLRKATDAYDVGTHRAIQILRDEFRQWDP